MQKIKIYLQKLKEQNNYLEFTTQKAEYQKNYK